MTDPEPAISTNSAIRIVLPSARVLQGGRCSIFEIQLSGETLACRPDVSILDASESERMERFRFEQDRLRFAWARVLLRHVLGRELSRGPADVPIELKEGRPYLASSVGSGIEFSISHSGDSILVAISRGVNIGIDVELVKPIPEMRGVARKVMTDTEFTAFQRLPEMNQANSFFQLWTRKESALKLLKTGFAMPPDRVEVGLAAARRVQLELDGQSIYVQSFQHNVAGQPYQVALATSENLGTATIQQVAVKPD